MTLSTWGTQTRTKYSSPLLRMENNINMLTEKYALVALCLAINKTTLLVSDSVRSVDY